MKFKSLKGMGRRLPSVMMFSALWMMCASWSQKGHDVTASIAEKHLTEATAAAVDSIFNGQSLVYWANWLDNASHTPEYAYSKTWHYTNVDENERFETRRTHPDGDAITAINYNIGVLSDSTATKDAKALALKMLVHIMGDLHQPMHMGRATDYGGNTIKVKFFNNDKNLHSVWDGNILESGHRWSYTEWVDQLDRITPMEEAVIVGGNVEDWARGTYLIAQDVYKEIPAGTNLSYNHVARWTPVIEQQLLFGGLRLAHTLNKIFDPAYNPF